MVYHSIHSGSIACNRSCENGLYIIDALEDHLEGGSAKVVLTEKETREFIVRLQKLLPIVDKENHAADVSACEQQTVRPDVSSHDHPFID